jgi:hypothetical protein
VFDGLVNDVRKTLKLKVMVLFLLVILLSGSAAVSIMVSGIVFIVTILAVLCLVGVLAAIAWFSKKKK